MTKKERIKELLERVERLQAEINLVVNELKDISDSVDTESEEIILASVRFISSKGTLSKKTYDYIVPSSMESTIKVGSMVKAGFGNAKVLNLSLIPFTELDDDIDYVELDGFGEEE